MATAAAGGAATALEVTRERRSLLYSAGRAVGAPFTLVGASGLSADGLGSSRPTPVPQSGRRDEPSLEVKTPLELKTPLERKASGAVRRLL